MADGNLIELRGVGTPRSLVLCDAHRASREAAEPGDYVDRGPIEGGCEDCATEASPQEVFMRDVLRAWQAAQAQPQP